MLAQLINDTVPFLATAGVTVLEAGAGRGRASVTAEERLLNHVGTLHAAVVFGLAEAASGAAIVGVLGDRLLPSDGRRGVRAVVADADITYRRPARGTVTATATIDDVPAGLAAGDLVERRNVSVTVHLVDGDGEAIGRAGFHWVITA